MLFYLEDHTVEFDCSSLDQFGEVPQVFVVVQPQKQTEETLYK